VQLEVEEDQALARRLADARPRDEKKKLLLERENREIQAQLQTELDDVK
jgi:hypothetical protein